MADDLLPVDRIQARPLNTALSPNAGQAGAPQAEDFVPKGFADSHRPKLPKTLVRIAERSIMA